MLKIIKDSYIYKTINKFILWLQVLIQDSFIYKILTREIDNSDKIKDSFFTKVLNKVLEMIQKVFKFLMLDKIFKDSIFSNTIVWLSITIALVPFLSTILSLLLVIITIGSFILKIGTDENFKFAYAPVNIWILLFAIIYLFSACISLDFGSSVKIAAIVLSFILLYFVIVNSVKSRKEISLLIRIFVLVGAMVSMYGILQYYTGASFGSSSFVDQEMFEDITGRANGTFDNPNTFGTYLLFTIPLSISLFFSEEKWFQKIVMMGCFFVMTIALALTYSRGCYLGVILAIGIFMLLANLKFIILFLGALIASPFVLPSSIINRFTSIGNLTESSASYRVSIWKGAIEMIKNFWYMPIGQGSTAFNNIYPLYALNAVYAEHSHNLFLQVIIETSVVGFVLFMGILISFYRYLLSGLKFLKDRVIKFYLIGFVSGLSGFLLQSIFDNTWYNNRIILIFWIFIGLAVGARGEVKNEEN